MRFFMAMCAGVSAVVADEDALAGSLTRMDTTSSARASVAVSLLSSPRSSSSSESDDGVLDAWRRLRARSGPVAVSLVVAVVFRLVAVTSDDDGLAEYVARCSCCCSCSSCRSCTISS